MSQSFTMMSFENIGESRGTATIDFMGQTQEVPYSATFFIDDGGTVAAATTADPDGGEERWLFLSRKDGQDVMTTASNRDYRGEVDGTSFGTVAGNDVDAVLAAHFEAVGDNPDVDKDGLSEAIQLAPVRAAELGMKLMAQLMAQFKQG